MSIQAPQGILNIPNATLRVGKLVLDEIVGADTIMNTVARNTILLVDDTEYTANKNWALKLPNAWAGVFDIKTTGAGKYAEFNFYNEGASSNAQGYNLTFNDTTVELRYDGGSALVSGTVSTVVNTYRKVHLLFERNILSVTVDGTLIFTYTDTSGPRPRVYSTTAGGFLNFFTDGGAIDTLKIVNEKWISDGTSNIAYMGGNLGIGVAAPGSKLSVTGNAYVSSNLEVGTANLFVDTVNSRVGIGTTSPVSGLTVFRDIESSNSFITERVLFKETWPNGHNSLSGDLGTWVVTNLTLQSNPGSTTTPDGYTHVSINGDDSANGEFVSPAFDLSDYAIVDGTLQADDKRKTTTRVFMKFWLGSRQLDVSGEVVQVQFSPDNGTTWYTVATSQDRLNDNRFTMVSADLSPYILETSTQAKIRFYLPWTVAAGDYVRIGRIWIHESDVPTNLGGMWLGAGGNIGIGTTNPRVDLEIENVNGSPELRFTDPFSGSVSGWDARSNVLGEISWYSRDSQFTDSYGKVASITSKHFDDGWPDGALCFTTSSNGVLNEDAMVIDHTGNVGIGTASPAYKLNILTDTNYDGISLRDSTRELMKIAKGNNGAYINMFESGVSKVNISTTGDSYFTGGDVGIGTASPSSSLHVNLGNAAGEQHIRATQTSLASSTAGIRFGDSTWDAFIDHSHGGKDLMNFGFYRNPTREVQMVLTHEGRVGINQPNPSARLHVSGTVNMTFFAGYYLSSGTAGSYLSTRTRQVAVYAEGDFMTTEAFLGSSDRRIKRDIVDINDSEALDTLRLLQPKKYKYKDSILRGEDVVWGFIAQEVREVLPYATKLDDGKIPNIYETAEVSESNVLTFTNFNTSDLDSNGVDIRIQTISNGDHPVKIVEIIDDHTIRVDQNLDELSGSIDETGNVISEITTTTLTVGEYETLENKDGCVANISGYRNATVIISIEEYQALADNTGYVAVIEDYTKTTTIYPGNKIFVYGQTVDNFLALNKSAIWCVATAALQEVDRQLQAEKAKVVTLETQLASVLTRLDALESA